MRDPAVKSTAIASALPGTPISEINTSRWSLVGKENENGNYTYYWYFVDEDFVKTIDAQLAAGRDFAGANEAGNAIINEAAARAFGFEKPEDAIGGEFNFVDWRTNKPTKIIGVVKNFYQRSPKEEHVPMAFLYRERGQYFASHFNSNDGVASIKTLETAWNKIFPGEAFNYFFVDEKFDQQYRADVQFGQVMATFSTLAVLIASLGLFGLSSYTILQRRKEIGIRKVLGASIAQVVSLLSGSYMKIIFIAALLAVPVSWLAVDNWLSGYTVRISITVWMFAIPIMLILFTALITVSFQTMRSALVNPATSLKDE
jgi:putative ABC transport system permease protein